MKVLLRPDGFEIADGADAVVPWWSFTKTLIAALVLTLVRDDMLSLDDALPGERFTLRQLLQHRAGLADYGALPAYHAAVAADEDAWPAAQLLRRVAPLHANVPPGGFAYSNVGYLLVRQHLERVTGEPLETLMQSRLFTPLAVPGPRIAMSRSDLDDVLMGAATCYDPCWVYHGLAVGSPGQAALLLHRLLATAFLPVDLRAAMSAGIAVDDPGIGRPWRAAAYGLGVMTGTAGNGLHVVGHTGGGPGSSIALYACPERMGATVAVFAADGAAGDVEADAFELLTQG